MTLHPLALCLRSNFLNASRNFDRLRSPHYLELRRCLCDSNSFLPFEYEWSSKFALYMAESVASVFPYCCRQSPFKVYYVALLPRNFQKVLPNTD